MEFDFFSKMNKYSKSNPTKDSIIGFFVMILFSRDVFLKNKDAYNFVNVVFGVSYLEYVVSSRTLLAARLSRHILSLSDKELNLIFDRCIDFFDKDKLSENDFNKISDRKNKNAIDNMKKWMSVKGDVK